MKILVLLAFVIFSIFLIGVAFWHERKWKFRRSWLIASGSVVGRIEGDEAGSYYPEIEFSHEGGTKTFVSKYGGTGCPAIGEEVRLIYTPDNLEAEHYTWSNRWLLTIGPVGLAAFFILLVIVASLKA